MLGASSPSGLGGGAPSADARVPEMMGRYAPVARLGKGGMADVFLTLAHGLQGVNKLAVVKRLRNAEDLALTEMFLDEARLGARLNHPNIVHTYEVGEVRGEYFIAMEYLEGQPLSRVMKTLEERCEGFGEPFAAYIAIQALKGLHHAHEFCDFDGTPVGVVHRDVSPHNLFLTYSGEIKLLDFGIAKATVNATHTEDGVIKGKVRYMAPEQVMQQQVDRRADIFAFGVVFWEMLARRGLFTGPPLSILTRIVNEEIPPVRGVRPDVSPALEAIALKAVRRDPKERYATAEEMQLDLEAYLRERRDGVSERDLSRLMNDMFASIREEVRSRVKAYISTMPQQATIAGGHGITSTGKLPVLPTWSNHPTSASWPTTPEGESEGEEGSVRSRRAPVRRARWPMALFAGLLVGAAAAGLFIERARVRRVVDAFGPPTTATVDAPATAQVTPPALPSIPRAESVHPAPVPSPADSTAVPSPSAFRSTPGPHAVHPQPHFPIAPAAPAPAPSASAAPPAPAPSASAPARPNIRMLDDTEAP
jgi:eukaryotic-like serine/threonine-protein kinase